jgi:predicted MFS family arabinose efflux permease
LWSLLGRNADFRRLFLAAIISLLGDWFAFVAVSGLVTELTGKSGMAAIVYAASLIPVFIASPYAGVLGDRVDRKRLLLSVDILRIFPALGLVAALHLGSAWLAVACVATIAALSAFFEPISEAVIPNLVAREDLSLAQAAMGTIWGSMLFVGAALGGIVAATLGRQTSFLINAASFAISASLVWRIHKPMQESLSKVHTAVGRSLHEVWLLCRSRLVTRTLLTSKAGLGLASGIVGLLPSFVAARYGGGDAGVGLLLAARGAGALMGPFLGQRWVGSSGKRLLIANALTMVLYGAAYLVFPYTQSLATASFWIVIAHVGGGAQWSLTTFGLQATTRDQLRGRVLSLDFGLATLSMGTSSLLASVLADSVGLVATSWVFGLLAIAFGVFWLVWSRPLWRSDTPDPLA